MVNGIFFDLGVEITLSTARVTVALEPPPPLVSVAFEQPAKD